jgi:hypothetical protein
MAELMRGIAKAIAAALPVSKNSRFARRELVKLNSRDVNCRRREIRRLQIWIHVWNFDNWQIQIGRPLFRKCPDFGRGAAQICLHIIANFGAGFWPYPGFKIRDQCLRPALRRLMNLKRLLNVAVRSRFRIARKTGSLRSNIQGFGL